MIWHKKKTFKDYKDQRHTMVEKLKIRGYIKTEKIAIAMNTVPRHLFIPEKHRDKAYEDYPIPIGKKQTISAPHMVAIMSEALKLQGDEKVLEIGAGTGYQSCVISHILKEGSVNTVEKIETLAQQARENIKKAGYMNIKVITGDGTQGHTEEAPYDRIIVTAAAPDIPKPLIEQLKPNGSLLIPVGSRYSQELIRATKTTNGEINKEYLGGCVFVPLIGKHGW